MKVLVAQNLLHVPAYGGANKANRRFAEQLAAHGHDCHLVAPLTGVLRTSQADPVKQLAAHGVRRWTRDDAAVVYELAGVQVHAVTEARRLPSRIRAVAAELDPDWIVVPSDDPAMMVLATALAAAPARVVYVAYTIQRLPCGPASFLPSATGTDMVRRCAGVLAISTAARDYLRQWADIEAEVLYPPVYGPSRPAPVADRAGRCVTMVNPCGYKGLPLFLDLAQSFPDTPFLAVPTWGTTAEDRDHLARHANIEVVEADGDLDTILHRTRVMLMPSLWDETFGFTCVDSMLHGVPVLASSVAGLVEAKLGVPYVLPVQRIEAYDISDLARPAPVIPAQDPRPWRRTLHRLLVDDAHQADLATRSRAAAVAFVGSLDERALEKYLLGLRPGGGS